MSTDVTSTVSKPLDWIEQINTLLFELEKKPQFGLPTLFRLDHLEQKLRSLFNRPALKVECHTKGWVLPENLREGIGETRLSLTIEWTPLEIPAYFVTTEQDLKQLMADLLGGEKPASFFYDRPLCEGFYHYFAAEMLRTLEEMQFASPLIPRLGESIEHLEEVIGQNPCFVIDFSLSFEGKAFWGRIILLEKFQEAWKSYFSHLPPPTISEEMLKKISVDLALEVGHVHLSLEEWKEVKRGDFILLDHCSYDPETDRGAVVLKLQNKPIFRGRFKEEGVKLTNYPIYEEVAEVAEEEIFGPEIVGEEDLYGDLEREVEAPKEEGAVPKEERPEIKPEELPVHLTVEVGSLRMTAQELMNLAPGNLLELNVSAKEGVDLVVNGKKIGRGELIRIGEALGVRIISF